MILIHPIMAGAQDADRRTIPIHVRSSTGYVTPYGSAISAKAKISTNFATAATSTNTASMVDATNAPGVAKLELAAAEVATAGDVLVVTLNGSGFFGQTVVPVVNFDPELEGAASALSLRHRMGTPV